MQGLLPELSNHLREGGVGPGMFASGHCMTLFASGESLPGELAGVALDLAMEEGWKGVYRVTLCLLKGARAALLLQEADLGSLLHALPAAMKKGLPGTAGGLARRTGRLKVTRGMLRRMERHRKEVRAREQGDHEDEDSEMDTGVMREIVAGARRGVASGPPVSVGSGKSLSSQLDSVDMEGASVADGGGDQGVVRRGDAMGGPSAPPSCDTPSTRDEGSGAVDGGGGAIGNTGIAGNIDSEPRTINGDTALSKESGPVGT